MSSGQFCKLPTALLARRDLTPAAKLVYAYLLDRQGYHRDSWPGQRLISDALGVHHATILRAIARLKSLGLLAIDGSQSDGSSRRYRVCDDPKVGLSGDSKMRPRAVAKCDKDSSKMLPREVAKCDKGRSQKATGGVAKSNKSGSKMLPSSDSDSKTDPPKGGVQGGGSSSGLFGGDAPSSPSRRAPRTWPAKTIDGIYAAYPRKRAPAEARRAIAKALQRLSDRNDSKEPAAWLLARVRLYADCRTGCEPHKTPFPATWLNQDRFDEDEADWRSDQRAELEGAGEGDAGPGSGYREMIAKAIKNQPVLEPPEGCEPDGL